MGRKFRVEKMFFYFGLLTLIGK